MSMFRQFREDKVYMCTKCKHHHLVGSKVAYEHGEYAMPLVDYYMLMQQDVFSKQGEAIL